MAEQKEYVTKTTAKELYKLTDEDLAKIPYIEKQNPHYRRLSMYLYPKYDIQRCTMIKYGLETLESLEEFIN